jgi:hypothetical protein
MIGIYAAVRDIPLVDIYPRGELRIGINLVDLPIDMDLAPVV